MQDINKRTENSVVLNENNSLFVNNHSAFIFKKIEKIATALYMVSDFFSEKEPLKWNIRHVCNALIKDTLILTKQQTSETSRTLRNTNRLLLEVLSYVSLGHSIGLVSGMNFNILRQEIEKLSLDIETEIQRHPDIKENFKKDFFNVVKIEEVSNKGQKDIIKDNIINKVDVKEKDKTLIKNKTQQKLTIGSFNSAVSNGSEDSSARQSKILDIIKEKGRVSIKDIVYQIPGCSSKTIQRDLVKLIQEGFVSKEGDRRWSIYFLKP